MLSAPICSMGRELLAMSLAGDAPSGILAAGKWEPKQVLPSLGGLIPRVHSHRSPLAPREDGGGSRCWSSCQFWETLRFNTEAQRPWHLFLSRMLILGEKLLRMFES